MRRMRIAIPTIFTVVLIATGCDEFPLNAPPAAATAEECAAIILVAKQKLRLPQRGLAVLDGVTRFDWTPAGCDWAAAGLAFRDFRSLGYSYSNIGNPAPEINFSQPQLDSDGIIVRVAETTDFEEMITTCRVSRFQGALHLGKCDQGLADPMDKLVGSEAVAAALRERGER